MEVSSPSAVGIPLNFSIRYPVFHFYLTVIKKLLKGGKEKKNGARVGAEEKERGNSGSVETGTSIILQLFRDVFSLNCSPLGVREGEGETN